MTIRQSLIKRLDDVFSRLIRRRDARLTGGRCFICRHHPIEVCFHWIPRSRLAVRWDPENACGACSDCNDKERNYRALYRFVFISIYGRKKRHELEERADAMAHFSTADLRELLTTLSRRLKGE